jgi:hypothetical protein
VDENALMKRAVSMVGRKFYKARLSESDYQVKPKETEDMNGANLIGSATHQGTHAPVFDFDFPAYLLPSSSPGKFHLYLEKEISWESYMDVLEAMVNAGLLEPGWVDSGINHGTLLLRPPGVVKENVKSLNHQENYATPKSLHKEQLYILKRTYEEWKADRLNVTKYQSHAIGSYYVADKVTEDYLEKPSISRGVILFRELYGIISDLAEQIKREENRLKVEQERTVKCRAYNKRLLRQIKDLGETPVGQNERLDAYLRENTLDAYLDYRDSEIKTRDATGDATRDA